MSDLAVFPLGSVLLPGMPLALRVFEPRYLALLQEVLPEPGGFGVVLIERGFEVGGGDSRFDVGTVARVVSVEAAGDAGSEVRRVLAVGGPRFVVETWLPEEPFPRAEVEWLPDLVWEEGLEPARETVEGRVRAAIRRAAGVGRSTWPAEAPLSPDPLAAAWQLAGLAPLGPLDHLRLLRSASVAELFAVLLELLDNLEAELDFLDRG